MKDKENARELSKELVQDYKDWIEEQHAPSSVNAMLAPVFGLHL